MKQIKIDLGMAQPCEMSELMGNGFIELIRGYFVILGGGIGNVVLKLSIQQHQRRNDVSSLRIQLAGGGESND